jgi:polysaccharide deacetylase family protein (PEP-CTERM system associated)
MPRIRDTAGTSAPTGTTGSSAVELRTEAASFSQPSDPSLPRSAFTIDVEDWYQSCVDFDAPITERVVRNTDRVLATLDEFGVKGTFFVQGRVAETFPGLVSSLVAQGHEVQSHGYSHRPLFRMSAAELRDELERGKKTVEDAGGTEVTMFRAGDFSILANLVTFDLLADLGFRVDSSIFPMRTRHYGIAGWPLEPHYLVVTGGTRILEVPVAIWSRGRARLPVAGGGYFRVLPRALLEHGLRSVAARRPAIVYCHPYEFNSDELGEYPALSRRIRLSQGLGRRSFASRVRALLRDLSFGRMDDVLTAWGLR